MRIEHPAVNVKNPVGLAEWRIERVPLKPGITEPFAKGSQIFLQPPHNRDIAYFMVMHEDRENAKIRTLGLEDKGEATDFN